MTTPAELERLAVDQARLTRRYSEPQRRYHTLDHVQRVLEVVDSLAPLAADHAVVRLAAWFHDSVYEPGRDDNERRSADLAADTLLGLGADHALVAEVARLVRLTEDHVVGSDDHNGMVLSDADLAILGAPTEEYDQFSAAVREEYAHVPYEAFTRGRVAVLRSIAERDQIYCTDWAREQWDTVARANLAREIAALAADVTG
jgi:predicted metal-dependent HD superfamily phosphohydrolase